MTPRMIVVTGGAGFIGSNIVARLTAETAYDVVVCDRLETADLAKWKNLAKHAIADFWSARVALTVTSSTTTAVLCKRIDSVSFWVNCSSLV